MARSWRNFFRKSTDEEQEKGPAVAETSPPEDVEEGNGHHPVDLEPDDEIPRGRTYRLRKRYRRRGNEPAPEDVWEVEEAASGEVEEALPEPTPVEEEPDAEAVAEAQESAGGLAG